MSTPNKIFHCPCCLLLFLLYHKSVFYIEHRLFLFTRDFHFQAKSQVFILDVRSLLFVGKFHINIGYHNPKPDNLKLRVNQENMQLIFLNHRFPKLDQFIFRRFFLKYTLNLLGLIYTNLKDLDL